MIGLNTINTSAALVDIADKTDDKMEQQISKQFVMLKTLDGAIIVDKQFYTFIKRALNGSKLDLFHLCLTLSAMARRDNSE
jgi:hypothetical protein